jgi:hypothetical protein
MKETINEYFPYEDYTILKIVSNKFGTFELKIDNEDVEKCKLYRWNINNFNRKMKQEYFYAISKDVGLLHRYILDVTGRENVVDHINGDMLDNRKNNLQICSTKENAQKQKFRLTNTSGYTGVYWYPYRGVNKWMAKIVVDYKCINLGYYISIEDAIKARKDAELKYFGEFQPIGKINDYKKTIES